MDECHYFEYKIGLDNTGIVLIVSDCRELNNEFTSMTLLLAGIGYFVRFV